MENSSPVCLWLLSLLHSISNFFLELGYSLELPVLCSLSQFLFHICTISLSLWAVFWAFYFFSLNFKMISFFTCISNLCFFLKPNCFSSCITKPICAFHLDHLNHAHFQILWTLLLSEVLSEFYHLLHLLTLSQGVNVTVGFVIF